MFIWAGLSLLGIARFSDYHPVPRKAWLLFPTLPHDNFSENQEHLTTRVLPRMTPTRHLPLQSRLAATPGAFTKFTRFCFKPQTSSRPGAAQREEGGGVLSCKDLRLKHFSTFVLTVNWGQQKQGWWHQLPFSRASKLAWIWVIMS